LHTRDTAGDDSEGYFTPPAYTPDALPESELVRLTQQFGTRSRRRRRLN
jgi:hypothetical protein